MQFYIINFPSVILANMINKRWIAAPKAVMAKGTVCTYSIQL